MHPPVRRSMGALAGALLWLAGCGPDASELPLDRPIQVIGNGYVSSQACRACHPGQYATWRASYHSTMTQLPTPQTVLGSFDDVELELAGRTFRLERRDDEFWVGTGSESGERQWRPVVLLTGSHHFQTYWLPTGRGRKLALFEFSWQIAEGRWIPMDALPLAPAGVNQVLGGDGDAPWNITCNRCHTTGSVPRIRNLADVDNRVAEFGIACEACHGPGERHVAENRDPPRRYQLHLSGEGDPTIVQPERLSHALASQVCGQCHGVNGFYDRRGELAWMENGFSYRPGDEIAATRKLIQHADATPLFRVTKFWSDGQVRVNGREYNSFLLSPCYQTGQLSCSTCHELHKDEDDARSLAEWADDQLGPEMRTNAACLQCHPQFREEGALEAHTHHPARSAGSTCYDCHMPHTAWGLHKATRNHQVDSPSIAANLATGRPNACNLCHLDRTLVWSARQLERWYGTPQPAKFGPLHDVAASVQWVLGGDAGQRALVAWHMGWAPAQQASGSDWLAPYLAHLLDDPYAATRSAAYRSLRTLKGFEEFEYDLMGSSEERADAEARALAVWQAGNGARRSTGRAILIDGRHRLRRKLFEALAAERNDRPIYLAE